MNIIMTPSGLQRVSSFTRADVQNLFITAATDASGIARDIRPAIERTSFAMHANFSLA
jgi:2-methylisocitrate lyase-like PEP mutase family enzyme